MSRPKETVVGRILALLIVSLGLLTVAPAGPCRRPHPVYSTGSSSPFVVARELSVAVEGKAMAVAAASTFMLALVAWLALWGVDTLIPVQGDPGPALIAL